MMFVPKEPLPLVAVCQHLCVVTQCAKSKETETRGYGVKAH
jgi:hypothetical protein